MEFAPGTLLQNGNYKLSQRAGKGGFGAVWKAQNLLLEKTVALKFLEHGKADQLRDMLRQEGRKLARIASFSGRARHIVYINHFFPGDDQLPPFLELEWIEGGNLHQRLKDPQSLSVHDILTLAVQLLDGLLCAHEVGIIHCDIKPSNILYSKAENLYKITDFGLAKNLGNLKEDRVAGGTLPYMSPEQFDPDKELSAASDIYSFGCMLFECSERSVPFNGSGWSDYRNLHQNSEAPKMLNRAIPEKLRELVAKCLHKNPADRPDGHTLRDEISSMWEEIQGNRGTHSAQHPAMRQLVKLKSSRARRPVILHNTTSMKFEVLDESDEEADMADSGNCLFPNRLPNNRDYLLMLREPAYRSWYPSMISPTAHDGGYLEGWFRDQPQNGLETDYLTSVPFQAAADFANWVGGRLPQVEDLQRLFKTDDHPLRIQIDQFIQSSGLPFLQFWCRDTNQSSNNRFAVMYRYPVSGPLQTHLSSIRRPAHYCFPHYIFIPIIPAGFTNDIPFESAKTTTPVESDDDSSQLETILDSY